MPLSLSVATVSEPCFWANNTQFMADAENILNMIQEMFLPHLSCYITAINSVSLMPPIV